MRSFNRSSVYATACLSVGFAALVAASACSSSSNGNKSGGPGADAGAASNGGNGPLNGNTGGSNGLSGGSNGGASNGGTSNGGTSNGGTSNGGTSNGGTSGGTGGAGTGGKVNLPTGPVITPGDPGTHDVLFTIDTTAPNHPISPYIYGTNGGDLTKEAKNLTMTRVGGNRLTAYNWETNASNAGSDYLYENDAFISSSKVAGDPMKQAVTDATTHGASIIMTVPIAGWVSADENSQDDPHPANDSVIAQHFFPILAKKGSAFAYPPDLTDNKVYADEFVSWLESQFPTAQTDPQRRIFYMLDNEPDLWSSTHSEIHPNPVTYAELVQKGTDFATAIKGVAPNAIVFGPVNYGWQGFVNLQSAPDANNRDFLEFYLDSMKTAEGTAGKRLVDVLDVHWYPEAQGGGNRIVDEGTGADEVTAREQAPRSLWDTSYTETSWITGCCSNGPIQLIPRLMKKITDHYPGTKLSISEYNYGGSAHISGGIAEADVLGIFGRDGMFAASMWPMQSSSPYIFGGFAMFRNFDGNGAAFGDTSISATNSASDKSSVYASVAASDGTNILVVAINKQTSTLTAGITLKHTAHLGSADIYTLTSSGSTPSKGTGLTEVAENAFTHAMPAQSVSTIVFHP